jgi:hypothetical protein
MGTVPVDPSTSSALLEGERNLKGFADKPMFEGLKTREIRYIAALT